MNEELKKKLDEISSEENLTLATSEDLKEVIKLGGTFRIKSKLHEEKTPELSRIYDTIEKELHKTALKLAEYISKK